MAGGIIQWSPDGTDNWQSGCSDALYADGTPREACQHCYARRMSGRIREMGHARYQEATTGLGNATAWTGRLTWARKAMRRAFSRMKDGDRKFFGTMTDLFHDACDPAMHEALAEEERAARGIRMYLTKRPKNLLTFQRRYFPAGLPPGMWVGCTAETQRAIEEMVPTLVRVRASVRFLSIEPLFEAVNLDPLWCGNCDTNEHVHLDPAAQPWCWECDSEAGSPGWLGPDGIHWIVTGCESGPGRRPTDPAWIRSLRDQCVAAQVPFFLKQMDVVGRVVGTPELDGRTWTEVPDV